MVLARVDAPPAAPPRYSLVVVAETPAPGSNNPRDWVQGWTFQPEACGPLGGSMPVNCGGSWTAIVPGTPKAAVTQAPFAVYAADPCKSTFGRDYAESQARSRRALAAWESHHIARELWTGAISEANSLGNPSFAGLAAESDTVTTAAQAPNLAMAALSSALAGCAGRGMIHVTVQLLELLMGADIIRRDGNLWLTAMGHIVVADSGYDGSGPDNAAATTSQWAYATPLIQVLRSDIEIVGGDPDQGAQLMENTVLTYAWRMAGLKWDECCLFAAEVNVAPPAIGGAG